MYYIEHSEEFDDHLEREKDKIRAKTLKRLHSYFANPNFQKEVILSIAYGYFESHEPSENIARELDLGKLEFLSFMDDFDTFKEIYMKEYEMAQNF